MHTLSALRKGTPIPDKPYVVPGLEGPNPPAMFYHEAAEETSCHHFFKNLISALNVLL